MKKIYVVGGTTGEYSNRTDWNVCAYRSKKKAETHVRNAMLRAKELETSKAGRYDSIQDGLNEFDPDMQMDYTGTEYFVSVVDLRD